MHRILIVDDSRLTRSLLKTQLMGAGFEIAGEAEDGRQAVELYAKLLPDLVTMDVTMPQMDGITASQAIWETFPEARILLVTSLDHRELRLKVQDKGNAGLLSKPFTAEQLKEEVTRLLRQSR
ncbi:MAG: response regulator [Acidobacteriota bacterium]